MTVAVISGPQAFSHHDERTVQIPAPPAAVFAYLDDHTRLAAHMSKPSWQMGGARMETVLDQGRGQIVGSHIRMGGRVFGIELSLDEVVTSRVPPFSKTWETLGSPRLLVVGPYRMGFQVEPQESGSLLRVFIDY